MSGISPAKHGSSPMTVNDLDGKDLGFTYVLIIAFFFFGPDLLTALSIARHYRQF